MTPDELREQIADLRGRKEDHGIKSDGIKLALLRDRPPTGARIGFAGRYGPRGEILNVKAVGDRFQIVALFDCQRILDWMDKEGL